MLKATGDLIESWLTSDACTQLKDDYNRCDGIPQAKLEDIWSRNYGAVSVAAS